MSVLQFLRARLAERSSRVQLIVLAIVALSLTGIVTLEQVQDYIGKLSPLLLALGPLATILTPDKNHDVVAAAGQDEIVRTALDMATKAAEDAAGPQATAVAQGVGAVMDKLGL